MASAHPLAHAFLEARPSPSSAVGDGGPFEAALETTLDEAYRQARRAWPGVDLSAERFVRGLAPRAQWDAIAEGNEPLTGLRTDDVYLALACQHAEPKAIEAFRNEYINNIRAQAARIRRPDLMDDLVQRVMTKLFVAEPDAEPSITRYSGRGSLHGWINVVAAREALNSIRSKTEILSDEMELLADRALEAYDSELVALKRIYRTQFAAAFKAALRELGTRHRNILRMQYIDGLNIDQIGVVLGTHRATIARWRTHARSELFEVTKRIMSDELKLKPAEFDSVMRLINSQLDVGLSQLLHTRGTNKAS